MRLDFCGHQIAPEEYAIFMASTGYERAHPARAWLRSARWARAWTRVGLTAALGLPKGLLSRLELDPDAHARPEYVARLREALGLSEADAAAITADPPKARPAPCLPRPASPKGTMAA